MKKTLFILCALSVLTACSNEGLELFQNNKSSDTAERIVGDFNGLKLNLTIKLDNGTATKATVKDGFAVNDVVFVTLTGYHTSSNYIELKKTGASEWTATPKNNMDLSLYDETGTMTAVYFPYGSSLVPYSSAGSIQFYDEEGGRTVYYGGLFYQAENAAYEINGGVLCGTLNLVAPNLSAGGHDDDKFIHFDITGYTDGHDYKLYQDYVTPIRFIGINAMGIVAWETGNAGAALQGYKDSGNDIISFSGLLNSSAVGNELDYQFSIIDWTDSIAYTRSAGSKTLSASKYIGIGDISSATWNATEFVDLGINSADPPYERIYWAKRNLGATADEGIASFGRYYAWGDVHGYYIEPDLFAPDPVNYPELSFEVCRHKFIELPSPTPEVDANGNLLPAYDAAKDTLKGFWRMPTFNEQGMLSGNCSRTYSEWGVTLTSNRDGFEDRSIFFPATGEIQYEDIYDTWIDNLGFYPIDRKHTTLLDPEDATSEVEVYYGRYWLSTKADDIPNPDPEGPVLERPYAFRVETYLNEAVYYGQFNWGSCGSAESEYIIGRPIRPVFTLPTE
ncbi:MAG: membrane lipoprotein lipid attachment site-containing protein [Bacteroidaceae bacterium]|nr:membrane lipoprotein lipid attachment site-containing protein [Bacteroidaceae bacterium]